MPQLGRIEQWDDAKGYGFVRPLESQAGGDHAARAFVHIRTIEHAGRRPGNGDLIRYETRRDDKGRLNAVGASFVNAGAMRAQARRRNDARTTARQRHASGKQQDLVHRLILAGALTALAAGTWLHWWPLAVTLAFAGMSALSFIAYALDKSAANQNLQRTQEKTLHLFDLLCGWPGGLLAQQVYRHKTRKTSFQIMFWITAALNCAALYWLLPHIETAS